VECSSVSPLLGFPMEKYPELDSLMRSVDPNFPEEGFIKKITPYLVGIWLDDYSRNIRVADIIETRVSEFSYLFDVAAERLIAAWGISSGKSAETRPKDRMKGHPLSAGPLYHRGHAIPHTLGGPTDINLVPQLGRINIGPFRPLEKKAVATPGSFYFTYWKYRGSTPSRDGRPGQTPTGVDQGLLIAGKAPEITTHGN
jgi:hypothetical protein